MSKRDLSTRKDISLILFDLAGVVVNVDFSKAVKQWAELEHEEEELQRRFTRLPSESWDFDLGSYDSSHFKKLMCTHLGVESMTEDRFVSGWNAVVTHIYPEVVSWMARLRSIGCRVAIVSNTNKLHSDHIFSQYPDLKRNTNAVYLSHELRLCKPDVLFFKRVLELERVLPARCLYFDDSPANISAASQLGIRSVIVRQQSDVTDVLEHLFGLDSDTL